MCCKFHGGGNKFKGNLVSFVPVLKFCTRVWWTQTQDSRCGGNFQVKWCVVSYVQVTVCGNKFECDFVSFEFCTRVWWIQLVTRDVAEIFKWNETNQTTRCKFRAGYSLWKRIQMWFCELRVLYTCLVNPIGNSRRGGNFQVEWNDLNDVL